MEQIQVRPATIAGPILNKNSYKEINQLYKTTTAANLKNRDKNYPILSGENSIYNRLKRLYYEDIVIIPQNNFKKNK